MVEEHLLQAREHAALGKRHIERQRVLVSELERDGHDTTAALLLLRTFEETQDMHLADLARLEKELADLDKHRTHDC